MTGAAIKVDARDFQLLIPQLQGLSAPDLRALSETLAAEVEDQTRARFLSEGPDPRGRPWAEWSEEYAATRHANQTKLRSTGHLMDSLMFGQADNASSVNDDGFVIGSNRVYAATHQYGRGGIPARPYLGLSAENEADLEAQALLWLEGLLNP